MTYILPENQEIQNRLADGMVVKALSDVSRHALTTGLMEPLQQYLARSGKGFRGQLVELGFRLASQNSCHPSSETLVQCEKASALIETLHAGSIIIDDIEDNARVRRGGAALHRRHGVPIALNAGNWLYFQSTSLIPSLSLSPERELIVHRKVSQVLCEAHLGQAMDISTRIDEIPQSQVFDLVLNALELKTGALMGLALGLGATIGGADEELQKRIEGLGRRLGIALQMLDDLGNLFCEDIGKRFEDFYLRRPTWVWAYASSSLDEKEYQRFVSAVKCLPDESFLNPWLELHSFRQSAKNRALEHLDGAVDELRSWNSSQLTETHLKKFVQTLREAYV